MPMDLSFIDGIDREADYPAEIARNFWIMDNHKWAFWAWEIYRCREDQHLPNTLVHIDYHFDSGNDWQDKRLEELQGIQTCEELLMQVEEGGSGSRIRFDNFIAPGFIRGLINHIDFYSLFGFQGFPPSDLKPHRCTQTLHECPAAIAQKNEGKSVLFDIFRKGTYRYY